MSGRSSQRLFKKFRFRLFLLTTLVVVTISASAAILLHTAIADARTRTHAELQRGLQGQVLAVERSTELLMLNVARIVASRQLSPMPSTETLRSWASDLGVTHIFLVGRDGKFLRSTNEAPELIPNLYFFCPDYVQLFSRPGDFMVTPIIPPMPEPQPYKFLTVAAVPHNVFVHIGLRVDAVSRLLADGIKSFPQLRRVALSSPNGEPLTSFGTAPLPSKPRNALETWFDSPHPDCCQSRRQGNLHDGRHQYKLVTEIDPAMQGGHGGWWAILLGVAALCIGLGWVLSTTLSRALMSRVERASRRLVSAGGIDQLADGKEDELSILERAIGAFLDSRERVVALEASNAMALQTAHDIRAPLSALAVATQDLSALSGENRSLIQCAVGRIHEIADGLLRQGRRRDADSARLEPLQPLVAALYAEKRLQYRDREAVSFSFTSPTDKSTEAYAVVDPAQLRRILSNIIDNAFEAVGPAGNIVLGLETVGARHRIVLRDDGCGLSPAQAAQLFQKPVSFGKSEGNGLALFTARKWLAQWAGTIALTPTAPRGCVVTIEVLRAAGP